MEYSRIWHACNSINVDKKKTIQTPPVILVICVWFGCFYSDMPLLLCVGDFKKPTCQQLPYVIPFRIMYVSNVK